MAVRKIVNIGDDPCAYSRKAVAIGKIPCSSYIILFSKWSVSAVSSVLAYVAVAVADTL